MSLIYGHRGASGHAPENTLEAFQLSMDMGADGFELDVHMSLDGELVVIHDETVDRTTNGKGYVKDMTLAQLKELDLGERLLLPENLLKADEDILLDDMTLKELEKSLQIPISIVKSSGEDFVHSVLEQTAPVSDEGLQTHARWRQLPAKGSAGRAIDEIV